MEEIFIRRSVRSFSNQIVEAEKIELLLKAAMQAPSAKNQQPWEFIVVEGKENLDTLSGLSSNAKMLSTANFAIIVLCNKDRVISPNYWQQDLAAATQNILLEAVNLGLGTVWLGGYPNSERVNYISNIYNLEENLIPFCVIAGGYPQDKNANKYIDRYDEKRIRYVK